MSTVGCRSGCQSRYTASGAIALSLGLASSIGCGESLSTTLEKQDETQTEDAQNKAQLEESRKRREAEAKAKAKAEAEHQALLDSLTIVPDELPRDLATACRAATDAHREFMERVYADDPETLAKWKEAQASVGLTLNACTKAGSIEVAACQKHALDNAPPELEAEAPTLIAMCIEKHGKALPGGVAPPT